MPLDSLTLWLKLLVLLAVANGAPLLGRAFLKDCLAWPLDVGVRFLDGQPLLGAAKTVRGVVLALAATALVSMLLGLGATTGALIATYAMLGDLVSSFLKRRLGRPPSSQVLGLDQIPESLFPLLAVHARYALSASEIASLLAAFFVLERVLSRLWYRLGVRERPY